MNKVQGRAKYYKNFKRDVRQVLLVSILLVVSLGTSCRSGGPPASKSAGAGLKVKPGVEVFLEKHLALVKGKKVGLVTNPSGVDSRLHSTAWLFKNNSAINLVALYGPEHGVRGEAQAGEYVPFYYDEKFGLPVFSLYGESFKPAPGMLNNIDELMRTFDTQLAGKIPEEKMIKEIDVLVFDLQDIGTRVYTYVATMALAMESCAELGLDFIVLDRPNPIGGQIVEGAILKYPEFSSFVGLYPIPQRHGLTVGELARLFNDNFLSKKARLTVIPMEGWKRDKWFDETGLPWVMPSPNMPTLETATVYPGQVYLEGTNISEGRGTTRPFELFGAPWIDGWDLAKNLNSLNLAGVTFREAWFTPTFSKYQGERCGGCQLHVIDREAFRPFLTSLWIIKTIMDMYPDKFEFHVDYFDKIMGNSDIRLALESGQSPEKIVMELQPDLKEFDKLREKYLLY